MLVHKKGGQMAEEKKRFTLWEHWSHKDKNPPIEKKLEDEISNPLKLHLGDYVIPKMLEPIKGNDHRTLEVVEILEYDRFVSREHFYLTDYLLRDKDGTYILRSNLADQKVSLLWLEIYYESEFKEEILDAVKHKTFKIDEEDGTHIEYQTLNTGESGVVCDQKIVSKDKDSILEEHATYWDFYRDVNEGVTELFFVEVNEETGRIMMLKGFAISEYDIEIIPK
jgi:hypothetical protein